MQDHTGSYTIKQNYAGLWAKMGRITQGLTGPCCSQPPSWGRESRPVSQTLRRQDLTATFILMHVD
jgi:hypothetical protein